MITAKMTQTNPGLLREVQKRMDAAGKVVVAVGYPADESGLGQPYYPNGASIIDVAVGNNYGTSANKTKRPFMDEASVKMKDEWNKDCEASLEALQQGTLDVEAFLANSGMKAEAEVKSTIEQWDTPPNSEEWARKKGKGMLDNNPLVDTSAMMNAATYAVRKR